jgi:hypothetical protein
VAAANARAQLRGRLTCRRAHRACGYWLNVELVLRETATLPVVDHVRVGCLPLPAVLPLLRAFAAQYGAVGCCRARLIERVTISQAQMTLSCLAPTLPACAPFWRLPIGSACASHRAPGRLTQAVEGDEVCFAQLLALLLASWPRRSAAGGDAAVENRAALTFDLLRQPAPDLADRAGSRRVVSTAAVVGDAEREARLPLHFSLRSSPPSPARHLTPSDCGRTLPKFRRGGSGFSFNDFAANRAGTRSASSHRDPTRLRTGAGLTESDFMPDVADLAEFLSEAELHARYGGVGGAAYKRVLADIEARIDALAVLQ